MQLLRVMDDTPHPEEATMYNPSVVPTHVDLDDVKPESAFHSRCICETPGRVNVEHRCTTCNGLHPDAIYFAIRGTDSRLGWMPALVTVLHARLQW